MNGELARIDPGRYVVRDELGRGAMGRVTIADDTMLGRRVAIKELLDPRPDLVARFRTELSLTARLQHPSIVTVLDGGLWHTGELACVMRLVPGATLRDLIASTTTTADRLALLPHAFAVVDAMAYAHSQQIIHRDLKPENILVGDFGETVVIDWGLAKDLSTVEAPHAGARATELEQTAAGAMIGTPAYMPPEQARGEAVDPRSDVYSIGAVLYHMLSGAAPHAGTTLAAVIDDVLEGRVVPLAQRAHGLPADLLAIVGKAMAVRPEDRYANAGELAFDLKRFQRGQFVAARTYSRCERAKRTIRKHRTSVAIVASAVLAAVGVGGASVTRLIREHERAVAAEQLASANQHTAEELVDFMVVDLRRGLEPVGKVDLMFGVASRARDYYDRKAIVDHRAILARENLADVLDDQGALRESLDEHLVTLALAETFAIADPATPTWHHDLVLAHRKVGYALFRLGVLPEAIAEFRASAAVARSREEGEWQLEVELADLGQSRAELASHDPQAALQTARDALSLATLRTRANAVHRREVMVAQLRVADALRDLGDHAGELDSVLAALALAERATDLTDEQAQRDLAIAHYHLGRARDALGDRATARVELEAAVQIDRMLVVRDPANATWQRELANDRDMLARL